LIFSTHASDKIALFQSTGLYPCLHAGEFHNDVPTRSEKQLPPLALVVSENADHDLSVIVAQGVRMAVGY
jgi:hypothetical protein